MELRTAIETAEKDRRIKTLLLEGAFLCSAYVIISPDEKIESWNLNYYIPSKEQIAPVTVSERSVEIGEAGQPVREKKFEPFASAHDVSETEALQKALVKVAEMKVRPAKTIVSLQKNGLEYWSLTFLESGGEALNVRIDAHTGEVLYAEKNNLLSKESNI